MAKKPETKPHKRSTPDPRKNHGFGKEKPLSNPQHQKPGTTDGGPRNPEKGK